MKNLFKMKIIERKDMEYMIIELTEDQRQVMLQGYDASTNQLYMYGRKVFGFTVKSELDNSNMKYDVDGMTLKVTMIKGV